MNKQFIAGYLLGVLSLVGCAAAQYRYYGVSMPDECYDKGQLLGKQGDAEWKDLPLSMCKPDAQIKGKCTVEFQEDHFAKDQEFELKKKELVSCQQKLESCESSKH
jgi:hypothetical protein